MNQEQKETSTKNVATQQPSAADYALHVALQTMKERCQSLQTRLSQMEEENLALRKKCLDKPPSQINDEQIHQDEEMAALTEKVGELTRQKFQLSEHIDMISAENRQLWSRLSKLAKDHHPTLDTSLHKQVKESMTASSSHQHLIRSKTFTQNSPHPILRQKINEAQENDKSGSLEEISLQVLNDFLEGKAEIEKKCSEIMSDVKSNTLGFGYLNDDIHTDSDLQNDIKRSSEGMDDIKKELLRQQSDLKVALSSLRQKRSKTHCNCIEQIM